MSTVLISELPQMLVDEQRADACNVKYHRPEDVFDLDKWDALVRAACATGGLPTTDGGMANIVDVNDWLTTGDPGLWSAFQLHNPLLPDMDGMFERDYAALPTALKERISLIFHFSRWDSLSPKERWDKVFEIDALNTPKSRLRFALGDVVFWGEKIGPLQTLSAAAERELHDWKNLLANQPSEKDLRDKRIGEIQQWVNRIDSLHDLMLIGCIPDTDDIGELVKLLQETVGQPWCCNVRFPVWVDQFNCAQTIVADQRNDSTAERSPDPRLAIEASDFADLDQSAAAPQQNHGVANKPKKPPRTKQRDQELEIVKIIKQLGHEPMELPKSPNGHSGVRNEVFNQLEIADGQLFISLKTFELAWRRCLQMGDLKYAT